MQFDGTDKPTDSKVLNAEKEALDCGRITPLLKVELWAKIQSRRLSEGKDELVVDFNTPGTSQQHKLTEEEEERQKNRKESNRLAALKCRRRKKDKKLKVEELKEQLENKNRDLKSHVNFLENEILIMKEKLRSVGLPLPPNVQDNYNIQDNNNIQDINNVQGMNFSSDKIDDEEEETIMDIPDLLDDEVEDIYIRSSQEVPTNGVLSQPQQSPAETPVQFEPSDMDSWFGETYICLNEYTE